MNSFTVNEEGVFFVLPDGDSLWICSKLELVAQSRDENGGNWGRLLVFKDNDGRIHELALPMSKMAGDGADYRQLLLEKGLKISTHHKARGLLSDYIMNFPIDRKVRCVARIGWQNENFVLPGYICGAQTSEGILFQREGMSLDKYKTSGSLEDWKNEVAERCTGNSRLVFPVSAAFAAPLLDPLGAEGGGFHFRGESSTGKTTALQVAGSVWGGGGIRGYGESWRATSNGLESTAVQHCDALLTLDELGQVDPYHAGEVAYMLANGRGKRRANSTGGFRSIEEWRVLFLSTGELGLTDHMAQAGQQSKAGQEVRMADIPADAGRDLGLFENLHGIVTPDAFSRKLREASNRYYGTAARKFLECFINTKEPSVKKVRKIQNIFVTEIDKSASGEVSRMAGRFGLVAAAGELAIEYGIVPWPKDEALSAAARCFHDWLENRGGYESQDNNRAISSVRHFLQQYGNSRFPLLNFIDGSTDGGDRAIVRAGFRNELSDGTCEWFIFNEIYSKEICRGFDYKRVSQILKAAGFLKTDSSGRCSISKSLPGVGLVRVYVISSKIMDDGN